MRKDGVHPKKATGTINLYVSTSSPEQQRDPGTIATMSLAFYELFTSISDPKTV